MYNGGDIRRDKVKSNKEADTLSDSGFAFINHKNDSSYHENQTLDTSLLHTCFPASTVTANNNTIVSGAFGIFTKSTIAIQMSPLFGVYKHFYKIFV